MRFLLGILLCIMIPTAFAANPEQFFQEWTHLDLTGPLGAEFSDLRYLGDFENRNDQLRPDAGIGYRITPLISVWSGYTQIISLNGNPLIYRPWQQAIWELFDKNAAVLLQIRSRSEQFKQEGQPEWSWRWRERARLALPNWLAGKFTPVVWEELFFNLNQPSWVSSKFISQNRAFIGLDSPVWKNTFVETGYINQYQFIQPVNRMQHILFLAFMVSFP